MRVPTKDNRCRPCFEIRRGDAQLPVHPLNKLHLDVPPRNQSSRQSQNFRRHAVIIVASPITRLHVSGADDNDLFDAFTVMVRLYIVGGPVIYKGRTPRVDCRDVFYGEHETSTRRSFQDQFPLRDRSLEDARTSTQNINQYGAPLPLVWVVVLDNTIPPYPVPFAEGLNGPQFIARAFLEGRNRIATRCTYNLREPTADVAPPPTRSIIVERDPTQARWWTEIIFRVIPDDNTPDIPSPVLFDTPPALAETEHASKKHQGLPKKVWLPTLTLTLSLIARTSSATSPAHPNDRKISIVPAIRHLLQVPTPPTTFLLLVHLFPHPSPIPEPFDHSAASVSTTGPPVQQAPSAEHVVRRERRGVERDVHPNSETFVLVLPGHRKATVLDGTEVPGAVWPSLDAGVQEPEPHRSSPTIYTQRQVSNRQRQEAFDLGLVLTSPATSGSLEDGEPLRPAQSTPPVFSGAFGVADISSAEDNEKNHDAQQGVGSSPIVTLYPVKTLPSWSSPPSRPLGQTVASTGDAVSESDIQTRTLAVDEVSVVQRLTGNKTKDQSRVQRKSKRTSMNSNSHRSTNTVTTSPGWSPDRIKNEVQMPLSLPISPLVVPKVTMKSCTTLIEPQKYLPNEDRPANVDADHDRSSISSGAILSDQPKASSSDPFSSRADGTSHVTSDISFAKDFAVAAAPLLSAVSAERESAVARDSDYVHSTVMVSDSQQMHTPPLIKSVGPHMQTIEPVFLHVQSVSPHEVKAQLQAAEAEPRALRTSERHVGGSGQGHVSLTDTDVHGIEKTAIEPSHAEIIQIQQVTSQRDVVDITSAASHPGTVETTHSLTSDAGLRVIGDVPTNQNVDSHLDISVVATDTSNRSAASCASLGRRMYEVQGNARIKPKPIPLIHSELSQIEESTDSREGHSLNSVQDIGASSTASTQCHTREGRSADTECDLRQFESDQFRVDSSAFCGMPSPTTTSRKYQVPISKYLLSESDVDARLVTARTCEGNDDKTTSHKLRHQTGGEDDAFGQQMDVKLTENPTRTVGPESTSSSLESSLVGAGTLSASYAVAAVLLGEISSKTQQHGEDKDHEHGGTAHESSVSDLDVTVIQQSKACTVNTEEVAHYCPPQQSGIINLPEAPSPMISDMSSETVYGDIGSNKDLSIGSPPAFIPTLGIETTQGKAQTEHTIHFYGSPGVSMPLSSESFSSSTHTSVLGSEVQTNDHAAQTMGGSIRPNSSHVVISTGVQLTGGHTNTSASVLIPETQAESKRAQFASTEDIYGRYELTTTFSDCDGIASNDDNRDRFDSLCPESACTLSRDNPFQWFWRERTPSEVERTEMEFGITAGSATLGSSPQTEETASQQHIVLEQQDVVAELSSHTEKTETRRLRLQAQMEDSVAVRRTNDVCCETSTHTVTLRTQRVCSASPPLSDPIPPDDHDDVVHSQEPSMDELQYQLSTFNTQDNDSLTGSPAPAAEGLAEDGSGSVLDENSPTLTPLLTRPTIYTQCGTAVEFPSFCQSEASGRSSSPIPALTVPPQTAKTDDGVHQMVFSVHQSRLVAQQEVNAGGERATSPDCHRQVDSSRGLISHVAESGLEDHALIEDPILPLLGRLHGSPVRTTIHAPVDHCAQTTSLFHDTSEELVNREELDTEQFEEAPQPLPSNHVVQPQSVMVSVSREVLLDQKTAEPEPRTGYVVQHQGDIATPVAVELDSDEGHCEDREALVAIPEGHQRSPDSIPPCNAATMNRETGEAIMSRPEEAPVLHSPYILMTGRSRKSSAETQHYADEYDSIANESSVMDLDVTTTIQQGKACIVDMEEIAVHCCPSRVVNLPDSPCTRTSGIPSETVYSDVGLNMDFGVGSPHPLTPPLRLETTDAASESFSSPTSSPSIKFAPEVRTSVFEDIYDSHGQMKAPLRLDSSDRDGDTSTSDNPLQIAVGNKYHSSKSDEETTLQQSEVVQTEMEIDIVTGSATLLSSPQTEGTASQQQVVAPDAIQPSSHTEKALMVFSPTANLALYTQSLQNVSPPPPDPTSPADDEDVGLQELFVHESNELSSGSRRPYLSNQTVDSSTGSPASNAGSFGEDDLLCFIDEIFPMLDPLLTRPTVSEQCEAVSGRSSPLFPTADVSSQTVETDEGIHKMHISVDQSASGLITVQEVDVERATSAYPQRQQGPVDSSGSPISLVTDSCVEDALLVVGPIPRGSSVSTKPRVLDTRIGTISALFNETSEGPANGDGFNVTQKHEETPPSSPPNNQVQPNTPVSEHQSLEPIPDHTTTEFEPRSRYVHVEHKGDIATLKMELGRDEGDIEEWGALVAIPDDCPGSPDSLPPFYSATGTLGAEEICGSYEKRTSKTLLLPGSVDCNGNTPSDADREQSDYLPRKSAHILSSDDPLQSLAGTERQCSKPDEAILQWSEGEHTEVAITTGSTPLGSSPQTEETASQQHIVLEQQDVIPDVTKLSSYTEKTDMVLAPIASKRDGFDCKHRRRIPSRSGESKMSAARPAPIRASPPLSDPISPDDHDDVVHSQEPSMDELQYQLSSNNLSSFSRRQYFNTQDNDSLTGSPAPTAEGLGLAEDDSGSVLDENSPTLSPLLTRPTISTQCEPVVGFSSFCQSEASGRSSSPIPASTIPPQTTETDDGVHQMDFSVHQSGLVAQQEVNVECERTASPDCYRQGRLADSSRGLIPHVTESGLEDHALVGDPILPIVGGGLHGSPIGTTIHTPVGHRAQTTFLCNETSEDLVNTQEFDSEKREESPTPPSPNFVVQPPTATSSGSTYLSPLTNPDQSADPEARFTDAHVEHQWGIVGLEVERSDEGDIKDWEALATNPEDPLCSPHNVPPSHLATRTESGVAIMSPQDEAPALPRESEAQHMSSGASKESDATTARSSTVYRHYRVSDAYDVSSRRARALCFHFSNGSTSPAYRSVHDPLAFLDSASGFLELETAPTNQGHDSGIIDVNDLGERYGISTSLPTDVTRNSALGSGAHLESLHIDHRRSDHTHLALHRAEADSRQLDLRLSTLCGPLATNIKHPQKRGQLCYVKEGDESDRFKSVDVGFDASSSSSPVPREPMLKKWGPRVRDALAGLVSIINRYHDAWKGIDLFFLHEEECYGEVEVRKIDDSQSQDQSILDDKQTGKDVGLTSQSTCPHVDILNHLHLVNAPLTDHNPIIILVISDESSMNHYNVITNAVKNSYGRDSSISSRLRFLLLVIPSGNEQTRSIPEEQLSLVEDASGTLSVDIRNPSAENLDAEYLIRAVTRVCPPPLLKEMS
ncbi:hypothetical protein BU15DRAFT_61429 [Melanogaster broomeanus]|nr:hypothetical protein BU15DRAFT_61429 [Melanogaster broomeanus]